ncbi:MAG: DsbA family protein [Lapillicoccus sp.]
MPPLTRPGHPGNGQARLRPDERRVLYADFTSPNSCLASHRIDALKAVDIDIEWRAVELHPHLPVMGIPLTGQHGSAVEKAMSAVTERLLPREVLGWKKPALTPHTQAAVAAFAEADGAEVPDDVRQLLIDAYWTRSANIGDPEVLRRLIAGAILGGQSTSDPLHRFGYAVSPSRGPITTSAHHRIHDWQAQWNDLDTDADVALVEEHRISTGLDALDRLALLITEAGAPPNPVQRDPGQYPTANGHPSAGWASTVGRPWGD